MQDTYERNFVTGSGLIILSLDGLLRVQSLPVTISCTGNLTLDLILYLLSCRKLSCIFC